MNRDYWRARWESGQIGFHQPGPTPALAALIERVSPDTGSKVLVPLCGKTKDLTFLADRGHRVAGVEWVEQALVELFAENALPHRVYQMDGIKVFEGERITGYACDFLRLSPRVAGKFDWVFDRASLVTFDESDQRAYADHLLSFLEPGGRLLVIGFHYDPKEMAGPPSSVSGERIEQLFAKASKRKRLATRDALDDRFRSKGLTWLNEEAWLIEL